MADAQTEKKPKTEVTLVKMEDGREVGFPGKRRLIKDTLIDVSKVIVEGDTVTLAAGAVAVRLDLRDGSTRTYPIPNSLLARFAGHGGEQKFGDELASPADKPMSEADMVIALDDLNGRIQQGEWSMAREGGGFSGASVVIRALMEVTGKDVDTVKAFLQKKLDAAAAKNEKLSRKDLYDSFRNPNSKTGQVIERLEREERSKNIKVDADQEAAALAAS